MQSQNSFTRLATWKNTPTARPRGQAVGCALEQVYKQICQNFGFPNVLCAFIRKPDCGWLDWRKASDQPFQGCALSLFQSLLSILSMQLPLWFHHHLCHPGLADFPSGHTVKLLLNNPCSGTPMRSFYKHICSGKAQH